MIYDIGTYTKGKYVATVNGRMTIEYSYWKSLLKQCSHKYPSDARSYGNCSISKEWLDFQNFAEWVEKNYYQIGEDTMFLDKDFLVPHNTLYSPDTCVFVNRELNNFLTVRSNHRGAYPLGVRKLKHCNSYQAYMSKQGNVLILGHFNTEIEAFNANCDAKNTYAKELAEKYRGIIPSRLYNTLKEFDIKKYVMR